MAHVVHRPGPRALVAAGLRELRSSPADATARVLGLAVLGLFLLGGFASAARWLDGGVDGILSQRPVADGFEVRQVRANLAADAAGVRVGDVILARDGVAASDRERYWAARRTGHAGERVSLSIRRPGSQSVNELTMTLAPILAIPDQAALLLVLVLVLVLVPVTGTIVFLARPHDAAARLFFIAGLANAYTTMLFTWDKAVGTTVDPVWHWYAFVVPRWFAAVSYTHLLLLFPAVHPWVRWPTRLGWQAGRWLASMTLIYVIPVGLVTYVLTDAFPSPLNLGGLVAPRADATAQLPELAIPFALLTLVALVYGYRLARNTAARAAIWWLVFAIGFRTVAALWGTTSANAATGLHVEPLSQSFQQISTLIVYAAIAVALVRYRLFQVHPLVRRAIVYPLAIAIVVGIYSLSAGWIAKAMVELVGPGLAANPLVEGIPVLGIVALLHPLRHYLEALLVRKIDRARWAVESFAAEAEAALSGPATMPVETLLTTRASEALGLSGAWVLDPPRTAGGAQPAREQVAIELVVPVAHGPDRAVGVWLLGSRMKADPFDEAELEVLRRVARLAALRLDHERLVSQAARELAAAPSP